MQTNENQTKSGSEDTEFISRPNHLQFIELTVESYAGLNFPDKPLVIHFSGEEPILEVEGDQGQGKTSLLNLAKALMGDAEPPNSVNATSNTKSAMLTYMMQGQLYRSKINNKTRSLSLITETDPGNGRGPKQQVADIKSPMDVLRSHMGNLGVSPEYLRGKKTGDDQIKWIKELTQNTNPELAELEAQASAKYQIAYNDRTIANRDYDRIKSEITGTSFATWDKDNKTIFYTPDYRSAVAALESAPKNEEEVKTKFREADTKIIALRNAMIRLEALKESENQIVREIDDIDRKIADLQKQKEEKLLARKDRVKRIEDGMLFITERQDAPDEYEKAKKDLEELGQTALLRSKIEDVNKKMQEFEQIEARRFALNNTMVEAESVMKELVSMYTPAIEGLTIETGVGIDAKQPGVYVNGKNMAYLSESELWDFCLQVWKLTGTRIVFIENSTSLGSAAVERVNWFAENGGKVFMSTMNRNYKEMKVSFHLKKK